MKNKQLNRYEGNFAFSGPSHPWLVRAYAESAPYPTGTIFGQDMFQSGIIPSDTDYRIYRDFGEVPGMNTVIVVLSCRVIFLLNSNSTFSSKLN